MKSKKHNWNSILFVFYLAFLVFGVCSNAALRPVIGSIWRLVNGQYDICTAKTTIESAVTDELTYHNLMMEINGFRENLLGTRVLLKEDTTLVKSDSGSLLETNHKIGNKEISATAELIGELQRVAEENGAKFLYCAAPRKEFYEVAPTNAPNTYLADYKLFLDSLEELRIPYTNLADVVEQSDVPAAEMFYYTDHHWTTRAGFLATKAICEELNARYNFDYSERCVDMNQYDVTTYCDWFLGSKGKKVGASFTMNGADNFELIVPKFTTSLTEEQPFKNQTREGCFEEVVLYMENLEKDYYRVNTYVTYSGGDFRLQIIKNNLNYEGKKILIIRDSFACVVTPFLALQTAELHVCDVRDGDFYVGNKLNMKEYIKQIRPDYVLVLYTGVDGPADSRYDFFS